MNLINLAWQTLQQYNQTDLAGLFTYPAKVYSGFIPLVLFGLFSIVLLSTYYAEKRLTSRGDFFSSFAVAGFFIAVVANVMNLVEGLINGLTVMICVVVSIVGVILLFLTRDNYE
jgi:UDP-N-acetylmuramyl pentapeptide phosphotransferase/UDP-N-acetylglucosamine-1-phosphate transferase